MWRTIETTRHPEVRSPNGSNSPICLKNCIEMTYVDQNLRKGFEIDSCFETTINTSCSKSRDEWPHRWHCGRTYQKFDLFSSHCSKSFNCFNQFDQFTSDGWNEPLTWIAKRARMWYLIIEELEYFIRIKDQYKIQTRYPSVFWGGSALGRFVCE
jgi:hypothetical protein